MSAIPEILWEATEDQKKSSHIFHFMQWLASEKNIHVENYEALYQWSISHAEEFWRSFVEFADIFTFPREKKVRSNWEHDFIGVKWFEGAEVNYAKAIFRNANTEHPAILYTSEQNQQIHSISWNELYQQVSSLAYWMRSIGIRKGDRIVSVLPNIPENVVAFLAAQSLGAVWSSCSPDFGSDAILQRFYQIQPRLLFATDQVVYNGKRIDKYPLIQELKKSLPCIEHTVVICRSSIENVAMNETKWKKIMQQSGGELFFEPLAFDHPLWILYSSGTTGIPKGITHSVGGNLIEHLKVLMLHWDVHPGERFFWYSTTGWMMWNFSVASLLVGATLVLYDGSPSFPSIDHLWQLAADASIHHVGISAAYIINCQKSKLKFSKVALPSLRTIGSTGSPLPPDAYEWVYKNVKSSVWLISFSGGTDVCSGFVGGCILLPVVKGEIQCRLLGCDLDALDNNGLPTRDSLGEMVIKQPMPSMPIYFWDDKGDKKYRSSYFSQFPGVWWHGDFIELTSRGSLIVSGRSDATLNRDGIRIGTAEIYGVLDKIDFIKDSLIVCIEKSDGSFYMPLFVEMKERQLLSDDKIQLIKSTLRATYSPRHVPDAIHPIHDIPYTISGKKLEIPVKRILMGWPLDKAVSIDSIRNPDALKDFLRFTSAQ